MAINNINSIQNPIDLDYIQESTKDYVLQSLANLGQRLSVQGDGVTTKSFKFRDLVQSKDPASTHIGMVRRDVNGNVWLSSVNRSTGGFDDETAETMVQNTNDYIVTTSTMSMSSMINGVDSYDKNGVISVDDVKYSIAFSGMYEGNAVEFICESYDKSANKLMSALRIVRNPESEIVDSHEDITDYVMLYLYANGTVQGRTTYRLLYYHSTGAVNMDWFHEYVLGGVYDGRCTPESLIADATFMEKFTGSPISISGILANLEDTGFTIPVGVDLTSMPHLPVVLNYFTYDLTYLYRYIKEYYSNIVYKADNLQFKKQIMVALFSMVVANSTMSDRMYIPLDYTIDYACNTNDEWQVYYGTNDIIVKYIAQEIDTDYLEDITDTSGIVCYTDKQERVTLYNFSVSYDSENSSNVYAVNVKKQYTLPYINAEGYWVLNDIDTDIYAKGKNAGNPNIIIVESHEDTFTIVHGANRKSILEKLKWVQRTAYIEPLEKINLQDLSIVTMYSFFKVKCWIPDLSKINAALRDEWLDVLENSIILNVSDLKCIDYSNNVNYTYDEVRDCYGEHGVISTLWVVNEAKDGYDYLRKQDNSLCAADFNYITNMNSIVQWSVKNMEQVPPDNFTHTYMVFDASYVSLKNSVSELKTYIYGNIENRPAAAFNASNYNNELNLTVKFNDIVDGGQEDRITNVTQGTGSRYLFTKPNEAGYGANVSITTNSLYSYTSGNTNYRYNEYIPNYNVPSLDLGEILVRNENVLNRVNVITLDKYGKMYNTYVGSDFNDDKEIFKIGTSQTNINLGTDTMIDASQRSKFLKQREIDVDFPTTVLGGVSYTRGDAVMQSDSITYGISWTRNDTYVSRDSVVTYWTTEHTPHGRYIWENSDVFSRRAGIVTLNSSENDLNVLSSYSFFMNYAGPANKLYTVDRVKDPVGRHNIYIGDGIYVHSLLNQLGLGMYICEVNGRASLSNFNIKSNMPMYTYMGIPVVLQASTTMLLPDNYQYLETDVDKYRTVFSTLSTQVNKLDDQGLPMMDESNRYIRDEVQDTGVTSTDDDNPVLGMVRHEVLSIPRYSTFHGPQLEVTYYILNKKVNITINENHRHETILYAGKIERDY